MLLAIDVGNTQTVIGVYREAALVGMWRVATNKSHTADEVRIKLLPLFESAGLSFAEVRGAALASVVPQLTQAWTQALHDLTGAEALVCSAETAAAGGLFRTDYPAPHEIGADRIADAVAAKERYGAPVVVVDFGTAANIEVTDRDGNFVGGVIAPGVETSAAALFSHATRLAAIELADPHQAIGTSTETAIQAGIVYGEADRVDGLGAAHLRAAGLRGAGRGHGRPGDVRGRAFGHHHARRSRTDAGGPEAHRRRSGLNGTIHADAVLPAVLRLVERLVRLVDDGVVREDRPGPSRTRRCSRWACRDWRPCCL